MESLLRWGIENSNGEQRGDGAPQQPRQDLDPAIIDTILGRSDVELMKEALTLAMDERKSEDARLIALDDFEMLIEQIDNANNIEKLGMWQPLQQLLVSPTTSDEIKANVLWIIGTAVQNNPEAQISYLTLPNSPISSILSLLSYHASSGPTRSKAVYALSGLLKHNVSAVKLLDSTGGWDTLKASLEDPEISVRRKIVFLFNTLLQQTDDGSQESSTTGVQIHGGTLQGNSTAPVHPNSHATLTAESVATSEITSQGLQQYGIMDLLVQSLLNPIPHGPNGDIDGDEDYEEKLVRLIYTYVTSVRGPLNDQDRSDVSAWFRRRISKGLHWDLSQDELSALVEALQ